MMKWFQSEEGVNNRRFEEVSLSGLVKAVKENYLRLPIYQRDAIWSEGRICMLWDSILRGYPLPSFLVAKSKGESRAFQSSHHDARGKSIDSDKGSFNLLDGQQRVAAINSVYCFNDNSSIRLWIDVGKYPEDKYHPHNNKYWIYACTRVFPFGFKDTASGEHDFSILSDGELNEIWNSVHEYFKIMDKHEFYEYPLCYTYPVAARLPIPLDDVVKLDLKNKDSIIEDLNKIIHKSIELISELDKNKAYEIDNNMIEALANDLYKLNHYRIGFQLIDISEDSDDEINLFERIGRGGVQITQRQLAVSKIMMHLGKEANDSIAMFNECKELKDMLETEDIIHSLARIAYTKIQDSAKDEDGHGDDHDKDLIELLPARLKVIEKDKDKWKIFKEEMMSYCKFNISTNNNNVNKLQCAYMEMYQSIQYSENNIHGFSKAQLAQPDKNADDDGIVPISLHPLLYRFLELGNNKPDQSEIEDMIRWLLFVNGFVKNPKHPKLNRLAFISTVKNNRFNFKDVYEKVFKNSDRKFLSDLGLTLYMPNVNNSEVTLTEVDCKDLSSPELINEIFVKRILLQNWPGDCINWFIMLWNQRNFISRLYNDINYVPALYSKGRPFDLDHIVARNSFMYRNEINNDTIKKSLNKNNVNCYDIDKNKVRLTADTFRKYLPNSIANFRYWPRKLNRADHDITVKEKMNISNIHKILDKCKLRDKFDDNIDLWECSAISQNKNAEWNELPKKDKNNAIIWNEITIQTFFTALVKRHKNLYENAYNFVCGVEKKEEDAKNTEPTT